MPLGGTTCFLLVRVLPVHGVQSWTSFQRKHRDARTWLKGICCPERALECLIGLCSEAGEVLSRQSGGSWNDFCLPWDSSSAKLPSLFCVGLKKLHPAAQFFPGRHPWVKEWHTECVYACMCKHFNKGAYTGHSSIAPVFSINANKPLLAIWLILHSGEKYI